MRITIFEQNGFQKQVDFHKAIIRIGSSPASDIQLRSPHISPFHAQILYLRENPERFKVVNLTAEALALVSSDGQEKSLAAYATTEALSSDELHLNGFRLRFDLPFTSGILSTSRKISASIALPEAILRPAASLPGRITLKNEGGNNSCQFQIEISGLPEECFQIDPVPLMYAGGQEEVQLRFFHRQTSPDAGFQSVTISISAPGSYPGEQVILQQGIYIAPALEQALFIRDDMPEPKLIARAAESIAAAPAAPGEESAVTPFTPPIPGGQNTVERPEAEQPPENQAALPVRPRPAKVIRTPAESFWNE